MKIKILIYIAAIFFLFAGVAAADTIEVRSSLISNATAADKDSDGLQGLDSWSVHPNWSTLSYNLNNNTSNESMYVYPYGSSGPMTFNPDGTASSAPKSLDIYYETPLNISKYSFKEWNYGTDGSSSRYGVYATVSVFGDSYVVLSPENYVLNPSERNSENLNYAHDFFPDKLAKLVINNNRKSELKLGGELSLGSGYTLIPEQIDFDGQKAKLNLFKDGELVGSAIVYPNSDSDSQSDTMILKKTILGESDIQFFRCHTSWIFQGTDDVILEIQGVWLIDPDSVFTLQVGDEFGEFKVDSIQSKKIRLKAEKIPIRENATTSLGLNISIDTPEFYLADTDYAWGFFFKREHTDSRRYEIRSHIMTEENYKEGVLPKDFAGFYIDNYSGTESLKILSDIDGSNRDILEGELIYISTPAESEYGGLLTGTWLKINLFGKEHAVVSANEPNKMMPIITNSSDRTFLETGQSMDIGGGYALVPKEVDVFGNKVHLEMIKGEQVIASAIVDTGFQSNRTWTMNQTVLNSEIPVAKIYVESGFRSVNGSDGSATDFITINGVWLADYLNATELKIVIKSEEDKNKNSGSGGGRGDSNDDDDEDENDNADEDDDDILAYAGIKNINGVNAVVFATNENISLAKGKTISLTGDSNYSIKVANSNDLRFYVSTTKQLASVNSGRGGRGETADESAAYEPSNEISVSESPPSAEPSTESSGGQNGSGSNDPSPYGSWMAVGLIFVTLCAIIGCIWMKNK